MFTSAQLHTAFISQGLHPEEIEDALADALEMQDRHPPRAGESAVEWAGRVL